MPAPIFIPNELRQILKSMLEKAVGFEIHDSHSCKKLSHVLLNDFDLTISQSTLRRIFGFMKSSGSASLHSLDSLARVLGFRNWKEFYVSTTKNNAYDISMLIINMDNSSNPSFSGALEHLNGIKIDSWHNAYQVYVFIQKAIQYKKFDLLDLIMEQSIIDAEYEDYCFFTFHPISVAALNKDKDLNNYVANRISNSTILQRFVLQGNVFDQYLNCFYGKWLDLVSSELLFDMQLFKSILFTQKMFINADLKRAKYFLDKSIELINNETHPILRGRVAAWTHLLNRDLSKFNELSSHDIYYMTEGLEFAAKLIWQYGNDKLVLPLLNDLDLDSVAFRNTFYQKGRVDVMRLMQSINLYNQNLLKDAKKKLKEVNSMNFHYSDRDWLQVNYNRIFLS